MVHKAVKVRPYKRFRKGRLEHVREHFRSHPTRQTSELGSTLHKEQGGEGYI